MSNLEACVENLRLQIQELEAVNKKLEADNLELQRGRDADRNVITMFSKANGIWAEKCRELDLRLSHIPSNNIKLELRVKAIEDMLVIERDSEKNTHMKNIEAYLKRHGVYGNDPSFLVKI